MFFWSLLQTCLPPTDVVMIFICCTPLAPHYFARGAKMSGFCRSGEFVHFFSPPKKVRPCSPLKYGKAPAPRVKLREACNQRSQGLPPHQAPKITEPPRHSSWKQEINWRRRSRGSQRGERQILVPLLGVRALGRPPGVAPELSTRVQALVQAQVD